jgi:uncharacterized membrane protein YbhN (UPF0104 family)
MRKSHFVILQYIIFLGLGIFLVWWSIKDLSADDRAQIRSSLSHARYLLIIPVFIILFLSHYIRALRWKMLLEPMGYHPSSRNTFFAVMIGYLTNMAFPRLGEVLKCTVLARYEKVPVDKLIGTIITERIIDAISLVAVFTVTLALQPGLYSQLVETFFQNSNGDEKKSAGLLVALIIAGIVILAVAGWMIFKKKNFTDLFVLVKRIALNVLRGVISVGRLKKRFLFISYTIIIWVLYLLAGYIGFFALVETTGYGIREAFSILSAGSIGMIVTPGGIGAYAILLEKTMMIYGLQKGIALAFGWLLWIVQTGVILLGGLFSFAALPFYNKKLTVEKP